MPMQKVNLRPGISTISTQLLSEGGWNGSNLIRWLNGYLQKYGGWQQITSQLMPGITRALHSFQDLDNNQYLALGSNNALEILTSGTLVNITPISATSNLTNPLTTVIHTTAVEVHDVASGASVGDLIGVTVPASIGGIVVQGDYEVETVIDADHYTFTAASAAASSVSGGGTTPQYVTTNTSTTVTVNLSNHGQTAGGTWTVHVSTSVGGLTLLGQYLIIGVATANQFTIQSPAAASSGATVSENSGNVQIAYYLPAGPVSDMPETGYGAGAYGAGTYGTGNVGTATTPARIWSLDNFGQNLLAVPTNGALYEWDPPLTSNANAVIVSAAPTVNWAMLVAMPSAQVFLLGSSVMGTQDPLLVRYSDAGDYTTWDAASGNQAGSYRLSRGSQVIGGIQSPQAVLIWTDIDLWAAQYIGYPFIWDFQQVQSGAGLWAQNGRAVLSRNTYWISNKGFFMFGDGGITPIPCDVWDQIFGNIDLGNIDKIQMGANSLFNEVATFFPSMSGGSGEVDSYVKYNALERLWDYGSVGTVLVRTAWLDVSLFGPPVGVDPSGLIYFQETGVDANGSAMTGVQATTGYVDVQSGDMFLFIDQFIPDFYFTGSNPTVTLTVYGQNWSGDAATVYGPYTITAATEYITLRARERQLAFKIECDSLGTFWRLGSCRFRGSPAGKV